MRVPCRASSESAQAMSAAWASRRARTSPSAPSAAMNWVPLMSESPSFAASTIGSRPERASASAPGSRSPSTHASPSPTSGSARWASGARSPDAPTEPRARHVRDEAAVQAVDQELDGLDPRAGVALGERVRAQQHRRAHDLVGVGLADAAGVAPQQAQLQLRGLLLRDRLRDEAAEARVDAVGVLAGAVRGPLDDRAGGAHLRPRLVGELGRVPLDGDRPDVRSGEVVAGEPDRGPLRHRAASVRRVLASRGAAAPATLEGRARAGASAGPAAATTAPSGMSPTSSEPTTSAPRAPASAAMRSTTSCSGAACQSSMFMLTCTSPRSAAPARARERRGSRPPPRAPPPRPRAPSRASRAG